MGIDKDIQEHTSKLKSLTALWHRLIHGDENEVVDTESGQRKSVEGRLVEIRAFMNQQVGDLAGALATALGYRNDAQAAKTSAQSARDTANSHKNTAKGYKDQAVSSASAAAESQSDVEERQQDVIDRQQQIVDERDSQINAIQSEGTTQKKTVESAGGSQVSAIQSEGSTQKSKVTSEGSKQVQAVKSEGNDYISAIETEGANQKSAVTGQGDTEVGRVKSQGNTEVGKVQSEGTTQKGSVTSEGNKQVARVVNEGDDQVARLAQDLAPIQAQVNVLGGRKNLIDNGDFTVWQRGESFTDHNGFTSDRWWTPRISASKSTDAPDGFTSSVYISSDWDNLLRQHIEHGTTLLAGKTVTVSFWIKKGTATSVSIDLHNDIVYVHPITSAFTRIVQTMTVPSSGWNTNGHLPLDIHVGGTCLIAGIQLELGDTATEFEFLHPADQLARCQRYFYRSPVFMARVRNLDAIDQAVFVTIPFPVSMRIVPSIRAEGDISDGENFTSWVSVSPNTNVVTLRKDIPAGGFLDVNWVEASAEI